VSDVRQPCPGADCAGAVQSSRNFYGTAYWDQIESPEC
jgi:hypothetical protein